MIGALYTLLLLPEGTPPADRFDWQKLLAQPQQPAPGGMARMAAHIATLQRIRQDAARQRRKR